MDQMHAKLHLIRSNYLFEIVHILKAYTYIVQCLYVLLLLCAAMQFGATTDATGHLDTWARACIRDNNTKHTYS